MDLSIKISSEKIQDKAYKLYLIVSNEGLDQYRGQIIFQPPCHCDDPKAKIIEIDDLGPGQKLDITMTYELKKGGCHSFYAWVQGAKLLTLSRHHIRQAGPGYYSGDVHTHSTYSDGKSDLQENRLSMIKKGHSFLYSTDHNTLDHLDEVRLYQQGDEDFLHMGTYEFTSRHGHGLAFGAEEIYDIANIKKLNDIEGWQGFVDYYRENFPVYIAHPYDAPMFELGDEVYDHISGISGIEVWNGLEDHGLSYPNQKSFALWDYLNLQRDMNLYGLAVSDAHTASRQGNPFIKGWLEDLTQDQVHKLLAEGNYFGSNGPEIYLEIGGNKIGQSLVLDQYRQYKQLDLRVFDPLGEVESISLYRGKLGEDRSFNKIWEYFPIGREHRPIYEFSKIMPVQKDEIYRAEVICRLGLISLDEDLKSWERGLAYTNPIWIR